MEGTYDNDTGDFTPLHPDEYKKVAHVKMPRRLSDPNHWGHLAWKFCEFMDALKEQNSETRAHMICIWLPIMLWFTFCVPVAALYVDLLKNNYLEELYR